MEFDEKWSALCELVYFVLSEMEVNALLRYEFGPISHE